MLFSILSSNKMHNNLLFLLTIVALFLIDRIFTSGHVCNRFSRIAVGKKPSQDPYKVVDVLVKDDARCFSICSHSKQCRSFLVEDNYPVFKCHFYNVTIHLLTMVPENSGMTFHSVHYLIFRDCVDWYNAGARETGVYQITLPGGPKQVRCNMDVDGGGWLVFQRRFNGTVDFNVGWELYKKGFGSSEGEFWLGNDILHYLTTAHESETYIHAGRFNGETKFSKYSPFRVGSEENWYKLYSPMRIDGIVSLGRNHLQNFTTFDKDNDQSSYINCAKYLKNGGFWYSDCSDFFPNGIYRDQDNVWAGVKWHSHWLAKNQSLKWTELMFRRIDRDCIIH